MSLSEALRDLGLEALPENLTSVAAAKDHEPKLLGVVATAYEAMRRAALGEGVHLAAASGFRSVTRQVQIWERKFRDAVAYMGDRQSSLCKVLEYSAPPGWSRHHWGSDVDLVAGELIDDARLEADDWEECGPCHSAGVWLSAHAHEYGFCRPYDEFRGGFLVEPWHWSFVPTSAPLLSRIQRLDWKFVFTKESFEGADLLADQVNRLFHDFVLAINPRLR